MEIASKPSLYKICMLHTYVLVNSVFTVDEAVSHIWSCRRRDLYGVDGVWEYCLSGGTVQTKVCCGTAALYVYRHLHTFCFSKYNKQMLGTVESRVCRSR